ALPRPGPPRPRSPPRRRHGPRHRTPSRPGQLHRRLDRLPPRHRRRRHLGRSGSGVHRPRHRPLGRTSRACLHQGQPGPPLLLRRSRYQAATRPGRHGCLHGELRLGHRADRHRRARRRPGLASVPPRRGPAGHAGGGGAARTRRADRGGGHLLTEAGPAGSGRSVPAPVSRRATRSWVVYDLANTIFALGVIGLYFPAWLSEAGLADSALSFVEAGAGIAVVFLAPWIGARTDAVGRRVPALIVTTLVAVAATATLASGPVWLSLSALTVALIAFNTGSVVYDALLPLVSTPA